MFAGIPIPFDIYDGDEITVCGAAYLIGEVPLSWTLGIGLGTFSCGSYVQANDHFVVTPLVNDEFGNSSQESRIACFTLNYEYPGPGLGRCDSFFLLGFHALGLTNVGGNTIKVTYTLNVKRGCT